MDEDLQLVVAVVCFGTAALVLGALAALLHGAVAGDRDRRTARALVSALLGWYGVALAAGYLGALTFPVFLPFALVPIALGTAATLAPRVALLLARVPAHRLVFLQVYRVAGAVFLYVYARGDDALSLGFARNAGWGDVLTGVLAVPVGLLLMRDLRGSTLALLAWSAIGVGDLILAPASAAIHGAKDLVTFPLNTIPLFLGPPLGILLHLVTLRAHQLRLR